MTEGLEFKQHLIFSP